MPRLDGVGGAPGTPQGAAGMDCGFGGCAITGDLPVASNGRANSPLPEPGNGGLSAPRLTVIRGDEQAVFSAHELGDGTLFEVLRSTCENSATSVTLKAAELVDRPGESRWKLLNLLRDLGPEALLRFEGHRWHGVPRGLPVPPGRLLPQDRAVEADPSPRPHRLRGSPPVPGRKLGRGISRRETAQQRFNPLKTDEGREG
jgi:hypothetical protein